MNRVGYFQNPSCPPFWCYGNGHPKQKSSEDGRDEFSGVACGLSDHKLKYVIERWEPNNIGVN